MISHNDALAAARAEANALGNLAITEVTPSRRDFRLYCTTQKESLAAIALLDSNRPLEDVLERAVACDDAEVAAIALPASLEPETVKRVSDTVTAPLVRAGYVVAANQIYRSRMLGFDAILLPASEFDEDALREFTAVASSVHMAAVVVARSAAELARAAAVPHAVIAVLPDPCQPGIVREWTDGLDARRTLILLAELENVEAAQPWLGIVDAVVFGRALAAGDPAAIVSSLA